MRVVTIVDEEGRESRGGGDGVVVGELQQGKDIFPCFLTGLHEGS